jgi:ATP/maltotriose-dependent transcriptional regulator MalT
MRSHVAYRLLDLESGLHLDEAAVREFERAGNTRNACLSKTNIASFLVHLGTYARAESVLSEALLEADRLGITYASTSAKMNLAHALAQQGALDRAHALAMDVLEASKQQGDLEHEMWSRLLLARILLAEGTLEHALAEALVAAQLTHPSPQRHAIAAAIVAQVFLQTGRTAEALVAATEAMEALRSLGSVEQWDAFIRLTFAEVLHASGDPDAARATLSTARDRLLSQADEIRAPDLRRSFLEAVPDHARTLALAEAWGVAGIVPAIT